ncbi:hypothetical protein [Mucilaginibacter auburnensis]|uniref:Uncharacterized protein n=1 Tax=Mucilaginibacter auburnensis TaxID=1457233 RepID=A0A2H9VSZ1_9SPHI|nr:hypothetical protein [Mucilaginibacter auburnensis]PJJ83928.1 hypothetical protein CLV57_0924 [Mucilaginibacter auburnensis]
MKPTFLLKINILLASIFLVALSAQAQDTVKRAVVKPAAKPVTTTTAKPVTSGIPINPKTGRPYSKWNYGTKAKPDTSKKTIATTPVAAAPTAPAAPVITDKSLNGQYQYLLTKVYNYQQPFIAAFWKNVRDSLSQNKQALKAANEKLATSSQSITELQNTANSKEEELSKAESVDFLGISFSKNGYSTMVWSIIAVLAALAAIVIFRSGSARSEATYRTKLYNELEEEYKNYKAKANEREKKLARELQTERNKVDELMGRG